MPTFQFATSFIGFHLFIVAIVASMFNLTVLQVNATSTTNLAKMEISQVHIETTGATFPTGKQ